MDCHSFKNDRNSQPKLELVDVFRRFEGDFLNEHGDLLSSARRCVMKNITKCRTAAVGGHPELCHHCGCERKVYNSCRIGIALNASSYRWRNGSKAVRPKRIAVFYCPGS